MAGIKVPIIKFSRENMERGSEGWASTMQAIKKAFEEYGCFEASYDEIGPKANDDLLVAVGELFDLDLETKLRFTPNIPFQGYSHRNDPPFECMALYDASAFHTVESFIRVLFSEGNGNAQIREILHSNVTKLWELEKAVRRMVFESFGVEDYFEEQERSMKHVLRIMKYGAGANEDSRGKELFPHYDKTFLTIHHEYGANGSSFLVIAGELFYGWSNARVQCPLHQVNMSEDDDSNAVRYSIAFASIQKGTVKIPSEMVDEEHPLLFRPFDLDDLIQADRRGVNTPQHNVNGEDDVPILKRHYAI